jgi:hypothetical protein
VPKVSFSNLLANSSLVDNQLKVFPSEGLIRELGRIFRDSSFVDF